MSERPDKESKTEDPTPKRLQEAVEKGNTPFSRELPGLAGLLGMLFICWAIAPSTALDLTQVLGGVLANLDEIRFGTPTDMQNLLAEVLWRSGLALAGILLVMMLAGLVGSAIQNPPQIAWDRIKPEFSRISPAKGLEKFYGKEVLVNFGKSLVKFGIAGYAAYYVLESNIIEMEETLLTPIYELPARVISIFISLLVAVAMASIVLALADLLWVRWDWFIRQKMTRQEVIDEHKQTDSNPMLRSKARSAARQRGRHRLLTAVADATLVVTNPTHFAVALRYQKGEMDAPVVVAKGMDLVALRIREVAAEHNIHIFEEPALARALYRKVEIDQMIAPEFYAAVANLIRTLYTIGKLKP